MPRTYTLNGPAGQIIARGGRLPVTVTEAITSARYEAGVDATGQLTLTFDDRTLEIFRSGLFEAGTATKAGSPLDWGPRRLEVRAAELTGEGVLTVTARALGVCKMQRARGTRVTPNVSPSRWVELEGRAHGLAVVAEPSPGRPHVTRQADEDSWDTCKRLAKELGFLAFEADGVLYFGRPTWLLGRPGNHTLLVDINPTSWQPVDDRVLARPTVRVTGDNATKVAELSVSVLPDLGHPVDPGWTLKLTRLPYLSGDYIVEKVTVPLDDNGVVSIDATTPINPTPEPPQPPPTAGSAGGGSFTGSFTYVAGKTSAGVVRSPGAGRYGGTTLNAEQVNNAVLIVRQGIRDRIPERGLVIALMTALQESTLRNLGYGDRDSVGLFQQRNAWAPRAVRMNPEQSAHLFYTGGQAGQKGLLDIKGWQSLPLGTAAQKVQVSAFPNAYAKWQDEATALVAAIFRTAGGTSSGSATGSGPTAANFVALALKQAGDRYIFGHEVSKSDPDPDAFDCSELVEWAAARVGASPRVPDGSSAQLAHVRRISVAQGKRTRGALLFHPGHVAISLGDGRTIEAANRRYGVRTLEAGSRFTAAGLLPGLRY